MNARAEHGRARSLISARLDEPLAPGDDAFLLTHLAACPMCRIVERELGQQHGELLRLGQPPAPRDLWARTSSALDREMARTPRDQAQMRHRDELLATRPGAGASRWLALSAVSSVTLAAIVVASQMQPAIVLPPATTAVVAPATPFAVSPQDIALIDYSADGVAVYQTRISEVCPQTVLDCAAGRLDPSPVMQLRGGSGRSRGVALHSGDGRVAVVADDPGGGETVSVVSLPGYNPSDDRTSGAAPTLRPTDLLSAPTLGGSQATPALVPTATPTAVGTRPPRPTVSAAATVRPAASVAPLHTKHPQQHATPAPTSKPNATPKPATPSGTPRPTRPPSAASPTPSHPRPTVPTGSTGSTSTAAPSRTPKPHHPTAGKSPAAAPSQPAPSAVPARTQAPVKAALAIAEGVRLAGAMPAWSPSGEMLAFSATPADRSAGPDLYLWHVGEAKASQLTHDHASYFASWDGSRIVVSRPSMTKSGTSLDLVVFDTSSGTKRAVADTGLWLPAVQPGGSFAIAWMGQLSTVGHLVSPASGHLFLIDWAQLDPYGSRPTSGRTGGKPRATSPIGSIPPGASTKPLKHGTNRQPRGPVADPSSANERRHGHTTGGGSGTPTPGERVKASRAGTPDKARKPAAATPPGGAPTSAPTAAPTSPPAQHKPKGSGKPAPRVTPSPSRPPVTDPTVLRALDANAGGTGSITDWIVRWADDGTAFGVWIADAPGGNWGRLTVERMASPSGAIANQPILGPNLARRTFSMSTDRVAWIAPSDGSVDGELRVRTWGAQGSGDLRIPLNENDGGVPAF